MVDAPDSSVVPTIIDPLPLPPNHGHQRHEINTNTLQEATCVPSFQKEWNSHSFTVAPVAGATATAATLSSQDLVQQGALKRNRGVYQRSIVTPGIASSLIHQHYPITSLSRGSGSGSITARLHKKPKTAADAFLKSTPQTAVGETNSIGKSSTTASRPPILMATKCDDYYLSEYQCLIRQQIEIFEA